jgi:hypothetical protein
MESWLSMVAAGLWAVSGFGLFAASQSLVYFSFIAILKVACVSEDLVSGLWIDGLVSTMGKP